jgi:hypothetical protein
MVKAIRREASKSIQRVLFKDKLTARGIISKAVPVNTVTSAPSSPRKSPAKQKPYNDDINMSANNCEPLMLPESKVFYSTSCVFNKP